MYTVTGPIIKRSTSYVRNELTIQSSNMVSREGDSFNHLRRGMYRKRYTGYSRPQYETFTIYAGGRISSARAKDFFSAQATIVDTRTGKL